MSGRSAAAALASLHAGGAVRSAAAPNSPAGLVCVCVRLLRRAACCSRRWRKTRLVAHQELMLWRDVRRMRPGARTRRVGRMRNDAARDAFRGPGDAVGSGIGSGGEARAEWVCAWDGAGRGRERAGTGWRGVCSEQSAGRGTRWWCARRPRQGGNGRGLLSRRAVTLVGLACGSREPLGRGRGTCARRVCVAPGDPDAWERRI